MSATETLQRWICESCGFISTPRRATPTAGSPRGRPSSRSPTPGSARCAERASATSSSTRTRDRDRGSRLGAPERVRRRARWHPYGAMPAPPRRSRSLRAGRAPALADGRELIDGMASWWCAIHGYRHPRAGRARSREQLGRMAHVMFGGLTHEPAVRSRERAGGARAGGPRARVLRGLGLGLGRGRDQAVPAVSARAGAPRAHAAADRAGRLSRRHARRDGAVRPGRRHAQPVRRCARRARVRRRPPDGFERPLEPRWAEHVQRAHRRARRRARRGDRRAGRPGRGRHALSLARVRRAAARAVRRARPAAGARRDRDRLRAHRRDVRLRARRGDAGRDVRRQGADRRLHDAGGDAVHGRGRRGRLRAARAAG